MHFTGAVRSAFRRAGDFTGRSTRAEFWYFFLLNAMIQVSAFALDFAGTPSIVAWSGVAWSTIALVPSLSLFIRRLRDAGYSPWMSLFALAGPIGAIVFLVLLSQRSVPSAPAPEGTAPAPRPDATGSRSSSLVLWLALTTTAVIVLGSFISASNQATLVEAEAEAALSRHAAAASSRAAEMLAAAKEAREARESQQAAAAARESREAQIFQRLRDAEASRSAEAERKAAAARAEAEREAAAKAEAYAQARDGLVAQGWHEGPDGVFYRWVQPADVLCPAYGACVQLKVTTPDGCPGGVTVDASELKNGTVTGSITGYGPGFLSGQNALVTLTVTGEGVDNISVKKMSCY